MPLRPETVTALEGYGNHYERITALRHKTAEEAEEFVRVEYEDLPEDMQLDLIGLASRVSLPDIPLNKSKMYAVLWICGATWNQLAIIGQVTKSTAQASATRYLPKTARDAYKSERSKCATNVSHEQVSAYYEIYKGLNPAVLYAETVNKIAAMVLIEYRNSKAKYDESMNTPDPVYDAPADESKTHDWKLEDFLAKPKE